MSPRRPSTRAFARAFPRILRCGAARRTAACCRTSRATSSPSRPTSAPCCAARSSPWRTCGRRPDLGERRRPRSCGVGLLAFLILTRADVRRIPAHLEDDFVDFIAVHAALAALVVRVREKRRRDARRVRRRHLRWLGVAHTNLSARRAERSARRAGRSARRDRSTLLRADRSARAPRRARARVPQCRERLARA